VDTPGDPTVVAPRASKDYGAVRFSSDGRWIAYDLDESGRREVYVVSVPDGQARVQISSAGGVDPRWSRDDREILYRAFDGQIMSVEIESNGVLRAGTPRPLFRLPEGASSWDVSSDGERFLVNVPVIKSSSVPLSVVVNWSTALQHER
jgi:Tol biopolymer transport system component